MSENIQPTADRSDVDTVDVAHARRQKARLRALVGGFVVVGAISIAACSSSVTNSPEPTQPANMDDSIPGAPQPQTSQDDGVTPGPTVAPNANPGVSGP